jgi:hypothetical protein
MRISSDLDLYCRRVIDDEHSAPMTDTVLVGPETESGGNAVLRHRDERLELGELRAVRLKQRPERARLFDVEVLATLPATAGGRGTVRRSSRTKRTASAGRASSATAKATITTR